MDSTSDKLKGSANKAAGKFKQVVGEATGSEKMKREGQGQEIKGDIQKGVGDAKEAFNKAAEKAFSKAGDKVTDQSQDRR
jgi:uncharacterized protein YjbJ (UPF0337 family)